MCRDAPLALLLEFWHANWLFVVERDVIINTIAVTHVLTYFEDHRHKLSVKASHLRTLCNQGSCHRHNNHWHCIQALQLSRQHIIYWTTRVTKRRLSHITLDWKPVTHHAIPYHYSIQLIIPFTQNCNSPCVASPVGNSPPSPGRPRA